MSSLYQYSHFLAVSKGCYDGDLSIEDLKKRGDIGLGTFNALDGELVVVESQFYHCSYGKVRKAQDHEKLPWAAITTFELTQSFSVKNLRSINELQSLVLEKLPSENYPVALQISAKVNYIELGSVPKQKKPYRPISEIIDDSVLIKTDAMTVDMVGFYAPEWMYPLKSSGLHLHFVDKSRQVGGHVLDLNLITARVTLQKMSSFEIIIPDNMAYQMADLTLHQSLENLPKFEDRLLKG